MKKNIVIVGAGKLGGALAIALEKCGYELKALITKESTSLSTLWENSANPPKFIKSYNLKDLPDCDIVFISTPDTEIQKISERIAEFDSIRKNKPLVLHTSGSLSSEALEKTKKRGCAVGSFHPLVSISDAKLGSERFAGAYFCLEGDETACAIAEKIVGDLQGKSFTVETAFKPLYHASAVTACGHLVALFDAATEMLQRCGLEPEKARDVLLPLVKSTVENLQTQSPETALTGTFARADVPTMQKHLTAIKTETSGEILEIYKTLGLRSISLAEKQGANTENLREMQKRLSEV